MKKLEKEILNIPVELEQRYFKKELTINEYFRKLDMINELIRVIKAFIKYDKCDSDYELWEADTNIYNTGLINAINFYIPNINATTKLGLNRLTIVNYNEFLQQVKAYFNK